MLRARTVVTGMSWAQILAQAGGTREERCGLGKRIFLESVQ